VTFRQGISEWLFAESRWNIHRQGWFSTGNSRLDQYKQYTHGATQANYKLMDNTISDMADSDNLSEAEIRHTVREEVSKAGWSVISTVFWTILAAFAVLVGLQAIQIAFYASGLGALAYAAVGILITGASVYLLYLLHWD